MRSPGDRPSRRVPIAIYDPAHLEVPELGRGSGRDDIGIEAVGSPLYGAVGDDNDVLDGRDQKRVDREPRPQAFVRVIEARLQPDGAARGIHLIVDQLQRALAECCFCVGTIGGHLQRPEFEPH